MAWRIYFRHADGNEDVNFSATQRDAIASAQDLLIKGRILIRLEADDGEIIEGKTLQDAVTMRHDPNATH